MNEVASIASDYGLFVTLLSIITVAIVLLAIAFGEKGGFMTKYAIAWDYDQFDPNLHALYIDGREFDDEQAARDQAELEVADEDDASFEVPFVIVGLPS